MADDTCSRMAYQPPADVATSDKKPPIPSRQPTPQSTMGLLSNANVRVDDRLDLLDFLEQETDLTSTPTKELRQLSGTSVARWGGTAPRRDSGSKQHARLQQSALSVALEAEGTEALCTLMDEIPSASPWYLQACYCICFPVMGVEGTMKAFTSWMPTAMQERVNSSLGALERLHFHQHRRLFFPHDLH